MGRPIQKYELANWFFFFYVTHNTQWTPWVSQLISFIAPVRLRQNPLLSAITDAWFYGCFSWLGFGDNTQETPVTPNGSNHQPFLEMRNILNITAGGNRQADIWNNWYSIGPGINAISWPLTAHSAPLCAELFRYCGSIPTLMASSHCTCLPLNNPFTLVDMQCVTNTISSEIYSLKPGSPSIVSGMHIHNHFGKM